MSHKINTQKYFRGIYKKTICIIVPMVIATSVIIVIGIVFVLKTEIQNIYINSALSGVEALVGQISGLKGNLKKIAEILEKSRKSKFRYFVYGSGTKPLYWSEGTPNPQRVLNTGIKMLDKKESVANRITLADIKGILVVARSNQGHVLILLEDSQRLQTVKRKGIFIICGLTLSLIMTVIFLMSKFMLTPMLKRLKMLNQCIERFGSGEREIRLVPQGDKDKMDEFDEVFVGFNSMADQICEYEKRMAEMAKKEKTLLAQLAHDINTPLTILRANAENLSVYGDSLSPEERNEIQTNILSQCIYMQALMDDLLTMASAKIAEISVNPSEVILDDIFDSVVNTFSPIAEQKDIVLLADGKGLSVWADPIRLKQIITNLVKNSIIHGGDVSMIEVNAHLNGEMVSITVKDDGQGMKPEEINTIFENFQRGEKKKAGGWGLGLAIVKMLSELQGGTCLFHKSEKGALFEVILPASSHSSSA